MSADTVKNNLTNILLGAIVLLVGWNIKTTQSLTVAVGQIQTANEAAVRQDNVQEIALGELRARITAVEIEFAKFKAQQEAKKS